MKETSREIVVVGSSPLLIAIAIKYKALGFNVTIFDKNYTIGGCWAVHKTNSGMKFEEAGHLLEWYSRGYQLFSNTFQIDMEVVNPSPLIVKRDGEAVVHTSKLQIALTFFKYSLKLIKGIVRVLVPGDTPKTERLKSLNRFLKSFSFFLVQKVAGLFSPVSICQPAGGFVLFQEHLSKLLINNQIKTQAEDIVKIEVKDNSCVLQSKNCLYHCDKVIMGESIETEICYHGKQILNSPRKYFSSYHLVCEIDASKISKNFTYIYFPHNKIINRITKTGKSSDRTGKIQILVQLRTNLDDAKLISILNRELIRLKVISNSVPIDILFCDEKTHPFPIDTSNFDCKQIEDRLELVNTYGDLVETLIRYSKEKTL